MIALNPPPPTADERSQILSLLAKHQPPGAVRAVIADAGETLALMRLYSFRSPHRAERHAAELSSRYRREILSLYGPAAAARRLSDSSYLRLDQLLGELTRVAVLRACRRGMLRLSPAQITQSDAMLLALVKQALPPPAR